MTDYTYTGQRSEMDAFGLMYYRARWYDPVLGRFAQADTIVPGENDNPLPLTVGYYESKFLEQQNQENRKRLEAPQTKSPSLLTNPLALDRYSYANNDPLRYTDPDGHFAFLVPVLAGGLTGGTVSTVTYLIAAKASGQELTWAGAAEAFAGGAVAGAVSVIATPVAGTLLSAAGISASGTALVAGTATVNAVGGVASYLAGGYTQNAVDAAMGKIPTFESTLEGALLNASIAGALSLPVGKVFPAAENTMRTLRQARYFMPGRTVGTLFATQNARNMYKQVLISVGIGAYAGFEYTRWE